MKIGVFVKQVPDTECKLALSPDCASIDASALTWVMNPYDEYAVEQALQLKEAVGGEVVVFSAGPARVEETMRQAFALGVDRGVRVDTGGLIPDAQVYAEFLAAAVKREDCAIVLAGKKSTDVEGGQVHIGVAEALGWPHVSPVEAFALAEDGKAATVTRSAGGSKKEIVEVAFPAVIGCEKGLNEPRYPTLPGKLKAKSKPLDVVSSAELGDVHEPLVMATSYASAPERERATMLREDAPRAAQELVRLLREEAKII